MYFVYVLKNEKDGYYIGYTENLEERLKRHNQGRSKHTSKYQKWILVHKEEFQSKADAIKKERFIKNKKSRKFIESLIIAG